MSKEDPMTDHKKQKLSFPDSLFEVFGWFQIVFSLLIIGCLIGLVIYILMQNIFGLAIAIGVAILGLIIGIKVATKAWKGKGTINLISRKSATPELDDTVER
jgi:uncharacterized protein YebE (UPF0316 family)